MLTKQLRNSTFRRILTELHMHCLCPHHRYGTCNALDSACDTERESVHQRISYLRTKSLPGWPCHAPQYLHRHYPIYSMPVLPDTCLCLQVYIRRHNVIIIILSLVSTHPWHRNFSHSETLQTLDIETKHQHLYEVSLNSCLYTHQYQMK